MSIKFEFGSGSGYGLYGSGTSGLPTTAGSAWTLSLWYRPTNETDGQRYGVRFGNSSTFLGVRVWNANYTASLIGSAGQAWASSTATDLSWDSGAVANGVWLAWRYSGGTTYSKWANGTKTAISIGSAITVPSLSGITIGSHTGMAYSPPTSNNVNGAFAELAVWTAALSDTEMAMLQRGAAADQIQRGALANYWPMHGVSATSTLPEPNYVNASNTLALFRTHSARETRYEHPAIYSPTTTTYSFPAWILKVGGTDNAPTFTAATAALSSETDYDVLGCTPPQTIMDVDSVVVNSELSDPYYGVQLPASATINLHNAEYRSHAAAVAPGRIGGGSTSRDPVAFWRLSSPSESGTPTCREVMSGVAGSTFGTVTVNDTGGLVGDTSTCMTFGGGAFVANMPAALSLSGAFTCGVWVKSANLTQSSKYVVASVPSNDYPIVYGYDTRSGQITALDSIVAQGSGYSVGNILTLDAGTNGTVRVVAVSAAGAVLGVELVTAGYGYAAATTYATSGGGNNGCTIKVSTANSTPRALLRWHKMNTASLHVDIPDTSWHHVAWTNDGTTGRAYLDGAIVGETTFANANGAGSTTIYIGAVDGVGNNAFLGSLQDLAYWSVALTSAEIKTLYRAGAGLLGYPPGRTWVGEAARLYRYDVQTHEYVAELAGSVSGAQFETGRAAITITDYDPAIFNTLIPRQTITVDQFPSGELGAPIPVPFGLATYALPQCGEDSIGNPGGRDFLVGHHLGTGNTGTTLAVEAAYYDQDDAPGLEAITGWEEAPGNPTRASSSTYTAANQSAVYLPGSLMRMVSSAASWAGRWMYGVVSTYSGSTVTLPAISGPGAIDATATGGYVTEIANAPVAGGSGYLVGDTLTLSGGTAAKVIVTKVSSGAVTEVQLIQPGYSYSTGTKSVTGGSGSSCQVRVTAVSGPQIAALDAMVFERDRYAIGTRNLSSIRLIGNTDAAGVVATVRNSTQWGAYADNRSPASVINEILSNTLWGLSETVDASSVTAARTDFYNAGLSTAINGALGGEKQQRAAGDVLNELLMMRGARLSRRVSGSWEIIVDRAPTTWTTLELGGARNNIVSIDRRQRTPASDAVSVLEVRYGLKGRVVKNTFQPTNDYIYSVFATAQSYGGPRTITLPWVRSHAAAARVAQYLARRMRYAEETIEVTVPSLVGRVLTLGAGVHLISAVDGIDGDYRVRSISRGLVRSSVLLESYDARLFAAYDSSEISYEYDSTGALQQADYAPDLGTLEAPGDGANLIANCDFSVPLTDSTTLPGFYVNAPDRAWTMSIDSDIRYLGGNAIQVATTNGQLTADLVPLSRLVTDDQCSTVVSPGDVYIFSFYADDIAGVSVKYGIFDNATPALATQIDFGSATTYRMSTDKNAMGWFRYYAMIRIRQPWVSGGNLLTPAMLGIYLECVSDGTTYKFDALQLEKAGQRTHKPTPWKRHAKWGVDPAAITPGDLTIRADGTVPTSSRAGIEEVVVSGITNGQLMETLDIQGKYVIGITAKVTSTIVASGATTWRLGNLFNDSLWGISLSLNAGVTTDSTDFGLLWTPTFYSAAEIVVCTAVDGSGTVKTITSGSVTVRIHYLSIV